MEAIGGNPNGKGVKMNKYRWPIALMVLASALAVALLIPASALAAKHTAFEASGTAAVTGAPGVDYPVWGSPPSGDPTQWRVIHAIDEPVDGEITSSDWSLLPIGSLYETSHDGQIAWRAGGYFNGSLRGTFTITNPDGDTLSGNIWGRVSGRAVPGDDYISDSGNWRATTGTGDLTGVDAGGTWEAYLEWDGTTYSGTITLRGTYQ